MSGKDIELALKERTVTGKAVKQLRRDGLVPVVIHDHGQESKIASVPYVELWKAYKEAGKHHPLALTLGKDTYTVLIKDVDVEPKKRQLRHVVFNAINQDEKVEAEVPVVLEGEIPAEKAGLMIITSLSTVQIEALPKNLVDELKVDGSKLVEVGDRIHVSDIALPEGITVLTEPEHVVAGVEETKEQISEETEVAEGEAAEGEETPAEGQTPAESTEE